jgi:hypothetical protein
MRDAQNQVAGETHVFVVRQSNSRWLTKWTARAVRGWKGRRRPPVEPMRTPRRVSGEVVRFTWCDVGLVPMRALGRVNAAGVLSGGAGGA